MGALLSFLFLGLIANSGNAIFLETESFEEKGGWVVDQQFMDQMGSPYLLAHGMGVPVEDAVTTVSFPDNKRYHVWVRTYDWTSPWTSKKGPGAFRIEIGGKALKRTLGTRGDAWLWQYAGSVRPGQGEVKLKMHDLTGFEGRCDAIYFSSGKKIAPPSDASVLDTFRRECGALPKDPEDGGKYDLVVVGGGIGGICTAVSAARQGLSVALVSDRPKLGGNNSSEVRVHLGGRIEMDPYPALGRMLREFGHSTFGNAKPAESYEDWKKDDFVASEPNVKLFSCYHAVSVSKSSENRIESVVIRSTEGKGELRLTAPLFCDCTGDGNLGFMAGAEYMMGREGYDEYEEPLAPEKGDKLTMGASVQWYSRETDGPSTFPEFSYGVKFNEENCEKVKMGEWHWETGMNRDQVSEAELVRDYGMMVIYSNWSYLKNHSSRMEEYENLALDWVAFIAGKRESRRLVGDYVLSQKDFIEKVAHPDATFTTTWHFDLHFPDPENSRHFKGQEFKATTKVNPIEPYAVPYRCLYSHNIENLFMAGRNISVTHVVLGSTRLMRTIAMMGEVVGMASAICRSHSALPRDVYKVYFDDLREMMFIGSARGGYLPDNQHFNED